MRFFQRLDNRLLSFPSWIPAALLGLVSGSMLLGCQRDEKISETRTEPWRAEDASTHEGKMVLVPFEAMAQQRLDFDVRGRKGKPIGSIGGIRGAISVPLGSLSKTRGEIAFDLREIRIENEQEANTPSWTREALRWLGLGEDVSPSAQDQEARFLIQSLRELSHAQPWSAPIRKRDDGKPGQIRKLYGVAVGTLKMRSLAVERHIPIWLLFYYDQAASPGITPEKIVVQLRGDAQVPLAEYEIAPRDARGHVISDQLALLGQEVGTIARVRGQLAFARSQVDGKGDTLAP